MPGGESSHAERAGSKRYHHHRYEEDVSILEGEEASWRGRRGRSGDSGAAVVVAPELSIAKLMLVSLALVGVQFTWSVELAFGTPYLLELGLSKSLTALVWLAGPLSGLLVQPIVGVYSDLCTSQLGRRRPFIIGGGIIVLVSVFSIAFSREISMFFFGLKDGDEITVPVVNVTILIAVTGFYLLDFSINCVQAMCRALIVDVCTLDQQDAGNAWAGRMLGIGNIIGYFVGYLDLPRWFPFLGSKQIQPLCAIAILVFVITVGVTCVTTIEIPIKPATNQRREKGWIMWIKPLWSIAKAFGRLPAPVQSICNVQLFAWIGWFSFLFYSTTWIGEHAPQTTNTEAGGTLHARQHGGGGDNSEGTRMGSFALLVNSIIGLVALAILPIITDRARAISIASGDSVGSEMVDIAVLDESDVDRLIWGGETGYTVRRTKWLSWLTILFSTRLWASLPRVWALSLFFYTLLMMSTLLANGLWGASVVVALSGIPYAITTWIPFTLLGEYISSTYAKPDPRGISKRRDGYQTVGMLDDEESGASSSDRGPRHRSIASDSDGEHVGSGRVSGGNSETRDSNVELNAGMVIGIHNIYIVLPQFVSTSMNAIIFAIFQAAAGDREGGDRDYDPVGWVMRIGGLFAFVGAFVALRVVQAVA
ncbi:hypothetical protein BJ742DRAFT_414284 [Cladochytrium replicatum]|nr:hypothetical protein BJ742DRAFT_414284 [Cladochytrium replicatum]